MKIDLIGILIVAFLGGGIVTFFGAIIKFFNAGDILNFYDEKKQDKNKVSKIVGGDLFYTGLGVILIGAVSIFLGEKYYLPVMISEVIVLIGGLLLSSYHFFFKCKKES